MGVKFTALDPKINITNEDIVVYHTLLPKKQWVRNIIRQLGFTQYN